MRALMQAAITECPTEAVVIHCTNFRGLPAALELEARHGVLVLDSVAGSLWGGARAAGSERVMRPDRLFALA
jgi:maleate cis-trans isomerase